MSDRWVKVAVGIPLLGLLVLIGRAEMARHLGPTWRLSIAGYDPRDLLHGHYLRYRFELNWQGQNSCGGEVSLEPGCCLCLTRSGEGVDPPVRQVSCEEAQRCDGWLRSTTLRPPLRYFVPEAKAQVLEDALRSRQASLELTCGLDGSPAIRELYLDGRPWREGLGD